VRKFTNRCIDRNIFPNFIVSTDLTQHINNEDIKSDFLKVKEKDKGVNITNALGWHSLVRNEDPDSPHLSEAITLTKEFVNEFLKEEGTNLHVNVLDYWLMENGAGAFNVVHNHGKVDLIGVYYIEVPPTSEGMTLLRTDAFTHTALCNPTVPARYQNSFTIDAIVGRVYIMPGHLYHYVKPFDGEGDRRSLIFNITCSLN